MGSENNMVAAPVERDELVRYALHYGARCRDCADESGVCPATGIECGERRRATEFIVDALIYGATNGFCPARLASPQPDAQQGTVAFVQEWMMSGDHEPTQWDREFAAAIDARSTRLRAAARAAHDALVELNPNNYTHDDVCEANDAAVEAILLLADVLGETHGKTAEWWADRRASLATPPSPALDAATIERCAARVTEQAEARAHAGNEAWKAADLTEALQNQLISNALYAAAKAIRDIAVVEERA